MSQKLTAIQTTLNSLIPAQQSNVLVTPPFYYPAAGGSIVCSVVNVSTGNREVNFQIIGPGLNATGGATVGSNNYGSFGYGNLNPDASVCKFTLVNGTTRSDVSLSATQVIGGLITATVGAQ